MTTVERALNLIGKKCFVDYFYEFKGCADKHALANQLLANNISATSLTAQMTRVNYAEWIFDNRMEKEALEIIINSKRLDEFTRMQARKIYQTLK